METNEQRILRWFKDHATIVGVFENHDLGHHDLGSRVAMPFDIKNEPTLKVGISRAPDVNGFIGWRYILVAVCHDATATFHELNKTMKNTK
jgi:hypothetical protein